jgi:hypothetical protein
MKKIIMSVSVIAILLAFVSAKEAEAKPNETNYCHCWTTCTPLYGGGQSCYTTCTGDTC